ncbi:MAG: leucine-rich repeat protein [Lachnospiraceae bacterium]|nr:leucine-rich repeat protein [Lachnospiraceae bacterium]
MSIKIWDWEKKPSTQMRYLKRGDIFCFVYDEHSYCFGRIIESVPKEYCIVEIFDYISDKPIIDEDTVLNAKRLLPPMNVDSKYVFQDKIGGDWRIIGHQDDFMPEDYDDLYMLKWDGFGNYFKVDFHGNQIEINEEERSKYITVGFHDPNKKAIREAVVKKLYGDKSEGGQFPTNEEELHKYTDQLFDARKYSEVIPAILSFPEDKMSRRLAGLLIASYNNLSKFDEALDCLNKFKPLFSDLMYRWYYYAGYALLYKKDYDKLPPIIDEGIKECERAYEEGKLTELYRNRERGHFKFFNSEMKSALDELERCKFINGLVIDGDTLIRYEDDGVTTDIVIPEGVKKIKYEVFRNNKTIRSVVIPEGVEDIGLKAFSGCTNLEDITFPSTLKFVRGEPQTFEDSKWYKNQPKGQIKCGNYLYFYTGDEEEIIIDDGIDIIGARVFADNKTIKKVSMPDSVKKIHADAFKNCVNLVDVRLSSKLDFISSYAFQNCISLEEIKLPSGMTKFANEVFMGCVNLKEVIFPDTIVELLGGIFDGCKNLEKVHLPDNAEGVTDSYIKWDHKLEGRMFRGCEKLREVTIPKGIKKVLEETFAGCTSIQKIVVENPDMMFGQDTFGKKGKYPEALYENSPELPLHLSDGDIKQYINLDKMSDDMKAKMFIKRQSKALDPFWEKSINKDNAKAIGEKINELKATKLSAKEKKNADMFFEKYGGLI